jgi:hypothetical protein
MEIKKKRSVKKILTQDQALKKKVGSYFHPTKKSYREGACPIGKILKRGYRRKTYTKKNGKIVKSKYIDVTCVKDIGLPGKVLSKYKVIKINKVNELGKFGYSTKLSLSKRFRCLIKAASKISYRSVVARINAIRTLSKANKKLYKIYTEDLKNLKKWRKENPKKYIKSKKSTKKLTKKSTKKLTKKSTKKLTKKSTKKI